MFTNQEDGGIYIFPEDTLIYRNQISTVSGKYTNFF